MSPTPFTVDDLPSALRRALDVAVDKHAKAPVILHVTDITGYTDWVLIVSGRSDRHVAAVAEGIQRELRTLGARPRGVDGFQDHSWDLLDYDEFMIHVFYHPVRTHYDLESMWSDATRVVLEHLPGDVMSTEGLDTLDVHESAPPFHGDRVFGGYEDEFLHADDEGEDDEALAADDDLGDDEADASAFEAWGDDDEEDDDDDLDDDDDDEEVSADPRRRLD